MSSGADTADTDIRGGGSDGSVLAMPPSLPPLPSSLTPALASLRGRTGAADVLQQDPGVPVTGRRVLITGGASGLGLALARACLERGDRVAIADLADSRPRPAAIPDHALYLRVDVRSEEEWTAARERLRALWGGVDVLVNNAGIAQGGRIDRLTEADWQSITEVNLLGVARGCRVFTPMFKAQGSGHLVNISSLAGLAHPPAMSSYSAVKAGVVALSESLRWELQPHGITVSVVCPSFLRTNLSASLNTSDPLAHASAVSLIERSPRSADQVAAAILRALETDRFLVLPDRDARTTFAALRAAPWAVHKALRDTGRSLARRSADDGDTPATDPTGDTEKH